MVDRSLDGWRTGALVKLAPPPMAAPVLKSFNTWAFKREQPSDIGLLERLVTGRVERDEPIGFVLYWGKGPRAAIGSSDLACLDYLATMGRRIAGVHAPGAHFTLCLTDTHARLNGHSETSIDSYFADVLQAAQSRRMDGVRLSVLVDKITRSGTGVGSAAGMATGSGSGVVLAPPPSPPSSRDAATILDKLGACAAKWYRGGDDAGEGARRYLAMNMIEREAVERHFADHVFVTFNGSGYRALFPPSMPIFYMYSMRRGTSVKPWFVDADGVPYAGHTTFE